MKKEECNYDGGRHIFENGICKLCGCKGELKGNENKKGN